MRNINAASSQQPAASPPNPKRPTPYSKLPTSNRTSMLIVLAIFFIVSILCEVQAIAISPGSANLEYLPNKETNFTFTVINNEPEQTSFVFGLRGDLAQYVKLPFVNFTLSQNQERTITPTIIFPANLAPAQYSTRIQVLSSKPTSEKQNTLKTIVGLEFLVNTQVGGVAKAPIKKQYSGALIGPHLEILSVSLKDVNSSAKEINAEIGNFGDAPTTAYADIGIINTQKDTVKTSQTEQKNFVPLSKDILSAQFDPKDMSNKYSVQVSLHYSNNTITHLTGMGALQHSKTNFSSSPIFLFLIIAIAVNMLLAAAIVRRLNKK